MEYFIVYDRTTGVQLWTGSGPAGAIAAQEHATPEGLGVLPVPQAALFTNPPDLAVIRAALCATVDTEAEAFRSRFITPGSGQAITYLRKEQEAAAYLADDTATVPLLEAEAAAIGITVGELAAEVAAAAATWLAIGAAIEATRRAAKVTIGAAEDLAALHEAVQVDWAALVPEGS